MTLALAPGHRVSTGSARFRCQTRWRASLDVTAYSGKIVCETKFMRYKLSLFHTIVCKYFFMCTNIFKISSHSYYLLLSYKMLISFIVNYQTIMIDIKRAGLMWRHSWFIIRRACPECDVHRLYTLWDDCRNYERGWGWKVTQYMALLTYREIRLFLTPIRKCVHVQRLSSLYL